MRCPPSVWERKNWTHVTAKCWRRTTSPTQAGISQQSWYQSSLKSTWSGLIYYMFILMDQQRTREWMPVSVCSVSILNAVFLAVQRVACQWVPRGGVIDSQAIKSVCRITDNLEVLRCRRIIDDIVGGGTTLRRQWIPGHAVVLGNEKAFKLARDGAGMMLINAR